MVGAKKKKTQQIRCDGIAQTPQSEWSSAWRRIFSSWLAKLRRTPAIRWLVNIAIIIIHCSYFLLHSTLAYDMRRARSVRLSQFGLPNKSKHGSLLTETETEKTYVTRTSGRTYSPPSQTDRRTRNAYARTNVSHTHARNYGFLFCAAAATRVGIALLRARMRLSQNLLVFRAPNDSIHAKDSLDSGDSDCDDDKRSKSHRVNRSTGKTTHNDIVAYEKHRQYTTHV